MNRVVFSCLLGLFLCGTAHSNTTKPVVVLLSIDGFAYEYLHKHQPTNILALANSGVLAKLQSVYPSKTFPNHLSIITGMYPINHGIMNNAFYNPELDKPYTLGAGKSNADWLKAEPLWTIAQQQGLKSAVYFWPESEALGKEPTYNIPFNRKDSNKKRFDQILDWLMLPSEQRPQFIVSYFSSVDSAGHTYGPNSDEVIKAIEEIDILIGEFIEKLNSDIPYEVNLIVLSDHGMVQKDRSKQIKPSMVFDTSIINLINRNAITVARSDTQLYFYFTPLHSNELDRIKITQQLRVKASTYQNKKLYNLYVKGTYPQHWQFNSKSELIPDLVFEALPPATFVKEEAELDDFNRGTHGYDPMNQNDLLGIFIALGPSIRQKKDIISFENIHIFPFLSDLLTIEKPENIDGTGEMLLPYFIKTKNSVKL